MSERGGHHSGEQEARLKAMMVQNEQLARENEMLREYLNRHTANYGDVDVQTLCVQQQAETEKKGGGEASDSQSSYRPARPAVGAKAKQNQTQALSLNQVRACVRACVRVRAFSLYFFFFFFFLLFFSSFFLLLCLSFRTDLFEFSLFLLLALHWIDRSLGRAFVRSLDRTWIALATQWHLCLDGFD